MCDESDKVTVRFQYKTGILETVSSVTNDVLEHGLFFHILNIYFRLCF